jgi:hypothetical protein
MSVIAHERTWTIDLEDTIHVIEAQIRNVFVAFSLSISVDGQAVVQEKEMDIAKLWRDYPLSIGGRSCVVRAFKKGFLGVATDFQFSVDEQIIPEGKQVEIADAPQSPSPQPSAPPAVAPSGPGPAVAVIPKLPPSCTACGTPLSMNQVSWVGPLTAECPSCGTNVEIEWRKIG